MLELSGLTTMRNTRRKPMHLRHAASGHGWITPMTPISNYPMANLQQFDSLSPSQDADDRWINEWISGCMKVREGYNGVNSKLKEKMSQQPMTNPPIRPEVGLSNFGENQEPHGLPQESNITDPLP
jgi:hypothetical protein